jgi:pimeloyl-ACP methyl ester carboxylesterase
MIRAVAIATLVLTALSGLAGASATVPAGEPPFPNSRQVDVDGVAIHVRDWWPDGRAAAAREPSRCPVLLVHALAGSTFSFRHVAPALAAAGHRVLAVDLPGYGFSERRPFPGSASAALWRLLQDESPGHRWCLVGHSMGARIVGQMVAEAPSRAAAVAYLSGSPVRERRRNPSMFRAQPLRGMVLAMAERRYLRAEGLAKALEDGFGRAPEAGELDAYLAPLRRPGTLPAILDGYARDMGPDRTDPTPLATRPSLVLWGGRDAWLKPAVGESLAAALPGSRWVLVDAAAHSPMETHPEAVVPPLVALFEVALPTREVAACDAATAADAGTGFNPAEAGASRR